jgi:hypothetical protein
LPKMSHRIEPLRSWTIIRFGRITCCVIWRSGSYPSLYASAIPSLPRTRRIPSTDATAFRNRSERKKRIRSGSAALIPLDPGGLADVRVLGIKNRHYPSEIRAAFPQGHVNNSK